MARDLPPLTWDTLVGTWHLQPVWLLVCLLALAAYVAGLRTCARHHVHAVHPVRVASFVTGLVLLAVTLSSSIDVYAMAVWYVHMVEHLLLIMVVPALLVLGHPLTVLRAVASTRGREGRVDAVLNAAPVALLTHPLVSLGIYTAVIVGTHLTSFMDAMVDHPWLMPAEQVLYLVSGYLFLQALVGGEPIRWQTPYLARIGLVLLGMTPDTVVGIVLLQTNHDMFPVMEATHPAWAPAPLADLQIAGGLMWAVGDGLMMVFGVGLMIAMISSPGRELALGVRLEGVRRRTLTAHVARGDTEASAFEDDTDVDDDDAVLAAYNRMLGRMSGSENGPSAH